MPFSSLESIEEIAREAPYLTAPVEVAMRRGVKRRYILLGLCFKGGSVRWSMIAPFADPFMGPRSDP